jgi:hypothetical protein
MTSSTAVVQWLVPFIASGAAIGWLIAVWKQ